MNHRDNEDQRLTVHLVPHSHDDLGWLKTVDEYFSGGNMAGQHANVKNVLDTVVEELEKDPERHFCYAEMGFFSMWYKRQD